MSPISVRLGCPDDAEAMAAIYVAAARRAWSHIYGSESLETLQLPTERLRGELGSDERRHRVLVAERDDVVLGFAVVWPSQDEDADRGQIGELSRELLGSAVNELRDMGSARRPIGLPKRITVRGERIESSISTQTRRSVLRTGCSPRRLRENRH